MTGFLIFILAFVSVIETTILAFPLTLIATTVISIVWGVEMAGTVFLGGLLLDLTNLTPLGSHSLFFLMVMWLTHRYQKKIHTGEFIYPMTFILGVVILYSLIFYRSLNYPVVLGGTVLGMLLVRLTSLLWPDIVSHKKRLTV